MPQLTPFQTVGPFFHHALPFERGETLRADATMGQPIVLSGTIRDGAGDAMPDALVEIWQANAAGRYHHPADSNGAPLDPTFGGFGRTPTDQEGRFSFVTIKPGRVPGPDGHWQAPHILLGLLGRGILNRLVTRIYFADETANDEDPILHLVPSSRRHTLLARREGEGLYRFDVSLQGGNETVFFDV